MKKISFLTMCALVLIAASAALAEGQRVRITLDDGSTVEGTLEDYGSRSYRVALEGGRSETLDEGRVRKVEFLRDAPAAEEADAPRVTLEFEEADVRTVIELLARQAGRNIVVAKDVSGEVTLMLKDVHWLRALRAVAALADCDVAEEPDLVRVSPRPPAEPPPAARVEKLFAEIDALVAKADFEALGPKWGELDDLLRPATRSSADELDERFKDLVRRQRERKPVILSLLLRSYYTEGERKLGHMHAAREKQEYDTVFALWDELNEHATRMFSTDAKFKQAAEDLLRQGFELYEKAHEAVKSQRVAGAEAAAPAPEDRGPTVSMRFRDADVRIILDLLGRQAGKYMSVALNVGGPVSVNYRNVPFERALREICIQRDLEYAIGGDGIVTVRRRGAAPAAREPASLEQVEKERSANEAALAKLAIRDLPGTPWYAIAGGKPILPPEESFLGIFYSANAEARDAVHRFVFRAGEEKDEEQDLGASQYARNLGMAALADMGIAYRLDPSGGELTLERGSRARRWGATAPGQPPFLDVLICAPGEEVGRPLRVVCGTGFGGPLTIDRKTALSLGLHRFAVPGRTVLKSAWQDAPLACDRVRVRVRIPELGADEEVVAAVVPHDGFKMTPTPVAPPSAGPSPAGSSAEELLLRDPYMKGHAILEGMRRALDGGDPEGCIRFFAELEAHAKKMVETDKKWSQPAEDLLKQGRELRDRAEKVRAAK